MLSLKTVGSFCLYGAIAIGVCVNIGGTVEKTFGGAHPSDAQIEEAVSKLSPERKAQRIKEAEELLAFMATNNLSAGDMKTLMKNNPSKWSKTQINHINRLPDNAVVRAK